MCIKVATLAGKEQNSLVNFTQLIFGAISTIRDTKATLNEDTVSPIPDEFIYVTFIEDSEASLITI